MMNLHIIYQPLPTEGRHLNNLLEIHCSQCLTKEISMRIKCITTIKLKTTEPARWLFQHDQKYTKISVITTFTIYSSSLREEQNL